MQDEGLIKIADFNIINRIDSTFPFIHSTELYPEWPLARLSYTDKALANKVAKALKLMPWDAKAAKAASIIGWTYAADYAPVIECLREIGYGVFAPSEKAVPTPPVEKFRPPANAEQMYQPQPGNTGTTPMGEL